MTDIAKVDRKKKFTGLNPDRDFKKDGLPAGSACPIASSVCGGFGGGRGRASLLPLRRARRSRACRHDQWQRRSHCKLFFSFFLAPYFFFFSLLLQLYIVDEFETPRELDYRTGKFWGSKKDALEYSKRKDIEFPFKGDNEEILQQSKDIARAVRELNDAEEMELLLPEKSNRENRYMTMRRKMYLRQKVWTFL